MALKQTAGRKELGEFAPKFAELNDDVLFGENWNNHEEKIKKDIKKENSRELPL